MSSDLELVAEKTVLLHGAKKDGFDEKMMNNDDMKFLYNRLTDSLKASLNKLNEYIDQQVAKS